MAKAPIRVLVTGAAGQIAYSLVPLIGKGDVFGPDQPVILHLLDIPMCQTVLDGVVMEITDCAYPLVHGVVATVNESEAFKDLDAAFLVGAMPRREGMERKDLLAANVKIFASQGKALANHSKPGVKVLVVGNPANTNALICSKFSAPKIPASSFTAMTRLDENRARGQVALSNNVPVSGVRGVYIWGNHSSTQFPDVSNATNNGSKLPFKGHDESLISLVQKRGAAIIAARKLSSAMSAAKAAADHMNEWCAEQAKNKRYTCIRSPASSADAMNKLKARTNYRAANGSAKKVPTTPTMTRRTMDKEDGGRRMISHRSVSPSRRFNGTSINNGQVISQGKVKAIMESNRLKTLAPKTPVVKFKDKFPAGKSVTSQYMQETAELKELFKRPDMNFSNAPRTVPGVRTGGMSPTKAVGVGFENNQPSNCRSDFGSSLSIMKRSMDDLYISQQANGNRSGAMTKASTHLPERSSPTNGHRGSTSGSSAGTRDHEEPAGPLPRWCHQCGTKYPMTAAKYCYECGGRRMGTLSPVH